MSERLTPDKEALLARWRSGAVVPVRADQDEISRRPDRSAAPLSDQQRSHVDPSPSKHISICVRIRSAIDPMALSTAVAKLVARHEILRSAIAESDDGPYIVVDASATLTVETVDLGGTPTAERFDAATADSVERFRQPFDLHTAPLVRAILYQLDSEDWVLTVIAHHLVADGWSLGIVLHEINALYLSAMNDTPDNLADVTLHYGDFAVWQQQYYDNADWQSDLAYWRQAIGDAAIQRLLGGADVKPLRSLSGDSIDVVVGVGATRAMRQLASELDVTPFMLLVSAMAIVLTEMTGQQDTVLVLPTVNRWPPATQSIIGNFVNAALVRLRLDGDLCVREVVELARASCLGAIAHSKVPFRTVVKAVHPDRSEAGVPLHKAVCVLQPPTPPITVDGAPVELIELRTGLTRWDLSLHLREHADDLRGRVEFNTATIDEELAAAFCGRLQEVLLALPEHLDDRLSTLAPTGDQTPGAKWSGSLAT